MHGPVTVFAVGDKVVHPFHGGGVVIEIVDKEFGDKVQQYYVIENVIDGMKHFIPLDKVDQIGMRLVVEEVALETCLSGFTIDTTGLPANIGTLKDVVKSKVESGVLEEIGDAIRLVHSFRIKSLEGKGQLNYSVSSMLKRAERMLSSHIALIRGLQYQEAEELLHERLSDVYGSSTAA